MLITEDMIHAWAGIHGGKAVWHAWVTAMEEQLREVEFERQAWDRLPHRDKELDRKIAEQVVLEFARHMKLGFFDIELE